MHRETTAVPVRVTYDLLTSDRSDFRERKKKNLKKKNVFILVIVRESNDTPPPTGRRINRVLPVVRARESRLAVVGIQKRV